MKAADVPDIDVLDVVAFVRSEDARWTHLTDLQEVLAYAPPKVVQAKARSLVKRGLLTGCGCGCRGDFELTDAGRAEARATAPLVAA